MILLKIPKGQPDVRRKSRMNRQHNDQKKRQRRK